MSNKSRFFQSPIVFSGDESVRYPSHADYCAKCGTLRSSYEKSICMEPLCLPYAGPITGLSCSKPRMYLAPNAHLRHLMPVREMGSRSNFALPDLDARTEATN